MYITLHYLKPESECKLENNSSYTIGRGSRCDFQIHAQNVSKEHAKLTLDNGVVTIQDLNSHNGTFIHQSKILEHTLQHGDVIYLGSKKAFTFLTDKAQTIEHNPQKNTTQTMPTVGQQTYKSPFSKGLPLFILLALVPIGTFIYLKSITKEEAQSSNSTPFLYSSDFIHGIESLRKRDFKTAHHHFNHLSQNFNSPMLRGMEKYTQKHLTTKNILNPLLLKQSIQNLHHILEFPDTPIELTDILQKELNWLNNEKDYSNKVTQLLEQLKKKEFIPAIAIFKTIPKESSTYSQFTNDFQPIIHQWIEGLKKVAHLSIQNKQFKDALTIYEHIIYLEQNEKGSAYHKILLNLQFRIKHDQQYYHALKLYREGNYQEAHQQLNTIPKHTNFYNKDVDELRKKISEKFINTSFYKAYQQGDVHKLLPLLSSDISSHQEVFSKIQEMTSHFQKAEDALQNTPIEDAIRHWKKICDIEPNSDNHFHKKAASYLDKWDHNNAKGNYYLKKGQASFQEKSYHQARKFFQQAKPYFPDQANDLLNQMQKSGEELYKSITKNLEQDSKIIIQHLENAQALLPANHSLIPSIHILHLRMNKY